jgi:hypothetical protein
MLATLLVAVALACDPGAASDRYEYCTLCCKWGDAVCLLQRGCFVHLRDLLLVPAGLLLWLVCTLLLCIKGCCKCSCCLSYYWAYLTFPIRLLLFFVRTIRLRGEAKFRDRLQTQLE